MPLAVLVTACTLSISTRSSKGISRRVAMALHVSASYEEGEVGCGEVGSAVARVHLGAGLIADWQWVAWDVGD